MSIDVSPPCSEPRYNWIYAVLWSLNAPGQEERECKMGIKIWGEEWEMLLLMGVDKWVCCRNLQFPIYIDDYFYFPILRYCCLSWPLFLSKIFFESSLEVAQLINLK